MNKPWSEVAPYNRLIKICIWCGTVLDKQIIDMNGVRVVRVNDLELTRHKEDVYVANVDISGSGLIRRMGVNRLPGWLGGARKGSAASGFISWDNVDLIDNAQPMRLKVASDKIADLHPADLAEILR